MSRSRRHSRRFGAIGPVGAEEETRKQRKARQDDKERSSGIFDTIASVAGRQVERGWFFMLCACFVVGWIAGLPFMGFNNPEWHLWLNSPTTSVTFLLVALLQNLSARSTKALSKKLDAALSALAEVLDNTDGTDTSGACATKLRELVGVEMTGLKE